MTDKTPWLPPWFEPLEIDARGHRKSRAEVGLNDDGRETLIETMRKFCANGRGIVEVGSWAGAHALKLAYAFPQYRIYCVDTWSGTPERDGCGDATTTIVKALSKDVVFGTFLNNVREKLFKQIIPCRGTSRWWAERWPFEADVVFIDADHSYEGVMLDLDAWWPIVAPDGLFCGHDYHLFPGVKRAVDEWFAVKQDQYGDSLEMSVEGECWFIRRKAVT